MAPTITSKCYFPNTAINLFSGIEQLINNAKEEILSNFRNETLKINSSLTQLSAKIEKVDNRIIDLEDNTANQQMQFENILADLKNIRIHKDESMDIFGEIESRMNRMNNVVISGNGQIFDLQPFEVKCKKGNRKVKSYMDEENERQRRLKNSKLAKKRTTA